MRDVVFLDDDWTRINDEFTSDGVPKNPRMARQVRTQGGMIVGRIVMEGKQGFTVEVFKLGQFQPVGSHSNFDTAWKAMNDRQQQASQS